MYVAEKGGGAFLNGEKIPVSQHQELKNSVVMIHLSSREESRLKTIGMLERVFQASMQLRMFGSSLAAMSYIASGRYDVYLRFPKAVGCFASSLTNTRSWREGNRP